MNILIIGGARFQGRYLVKELLDAGNTVTVFHKGSHAVEPRSNLTDLIGDRNDPDDLAQLASAQFDICIDTCAYFPKQVKLLGAVLKVQQYCLISSVYVYADQDAVLNEDAKLIRSLDKQNHDILTENYGALKVLCEDEALRQFGGDSLILRPSIIIGMGDHTERLLFWMRLVAVHGKRLDIYGREPMVQLVDVRDLARFTARCLAKQKRGAVNVCGESVSLSELLDAIEVISGRRCVRETINVGNLQGFCLERLPYCEASHLARHDATLSHAWGFTSRDLWSALKDIYEDSHRQGFIMRRFQVEEAEILRLFS